MKLCSIASSSSGNCIYVGSEQTNILIDIGISGKKVQEGLESICIDAKTIHGVLITHEHSDHIKGLGVIARRYHIPIYATKKTILKLKKTKQLGVIDGDLYREIQADEEFMIKDITIKAFSTSHDAIDSVCYSFWHKDKKISVATDLGSYDDYIVDHLKNANILFLEANHDIRMLEVGSYPYYLKQRILSNLGHLSNELSGKLLSEVFHNDLKYIVLGHLSNENNHDDVAYESVKTELIDHNIEEHDVEIFVASKYTASKLISI